ncbi:MAG TPA: helix-turn-helix transcriptional regulator [Verrucomicrobiae bacterium]|jgi:transcriptional regulator with XRE-family HTH domain|nr:helix-turn-helix transcriptional regulator [Verrucomicrobiae bacterium]
MKSQTDGRQPKRERDIARRLKEARTLLRFSQQEFAQGAGIGRERIASYEDARVPLRWEIALRLCRRFFISEFWLASGNTDFFNMGEKFVSKAKNKWGDEPFSFGRPRLTASLILRPIVHALKPGMLFSEAFDLHLREEFKSAIASGIGGPGPVGSFIESDSVEYIQFGLSCFIQFWSEKLPEDARRRFLFDSLTAMGILSEELGCVFDDDTGPRLEGLSRLENFMKHYQQAGMGSEEIAEKQLPNLTAKSNVSSMDSPLVDLLARLERLTRRHGKKANVARYVGVAGPRISEWLNGTHEPGGDVTLRLLVWVQAEESKRIRRHGGT